MTDHEMGLDAEIQNLRASLFARESELQELRAELTRLGPKTELELLGELSRAVLRIEANQELVRKELVRVNQRISLLPCDRCPPLSVAL